MGPDSLRNALLPTLEGFSEVPTAVGNPVCADLTAEFRDRNQGLSHRANQMGDRGEIGDRKL